MAKKATDDDLSNSLVKDHSFSAAATLESLPVDLKESANKEKSVGISVFSRKGSSKPV